MITITEKENFMKFMRGKHPAWIPRYGIGRDPYSKHPPALTGVMPGFMNEYKTPEGGFDIWGVEYVTTEDTGGMALPIPNKFILSDITKWRDIIRTPDISNIDWEAMAKKDLADIDRSETAVGQYIRLIPLIG